MTKWLPHAPAGRLVVTSAAMMVLVTPVPTLVPREGIELAGALTGNVAP